MTNLLEKTLLIGFGVFTIFIFFILITPFIERITDFKENDKNDVENYNNSISTIDHENHSKENHNKIERPNKLFLVNVEKISYDGNLKEKSLKPILRYIETFLLKDFLKVFHIKSSI